MKKLLIALIAAGSTILFCEGRLAAQSGGGGGAGGAAGAGGAGAAGAGGATASGAAGVGAQGGGVPAPSGTSDAAGGGVLGPGSTLSPSSSPVPSGATPRNPTMGGSLQTQAGGSLQTQPGTLQTTQPGTLQRSGTSGATVPSPNSLQNQPLQNPLTIQGSGANAEIGQGNQGISGVSSAQPSDQQQVQRVNPNDPRLTRYNNEWWYWMPGNYWMYYRTNNWNRYDPYAFQPLTSDTTRYQTGYRGTATGPVYYTDENGLRYRRFYAPELPRGQAMEAVRQQGNSSQTTNTEATIGGAVRGQQGPNVSAEIGGAVRNQ